MDSHKNFAASLVATAPSPASSGTSLVVTTSDGAKFPTPPFNATVWPAGVQPTTANAEIVRVTNITSDTLTITRAQESSSARSIIIGDQIAATVTVKTLTDVESAVAQVVGARQSASAIVIGHSYTVAGGTANQYQGGMVSRLQAMLGIHADNMRHFGQGGQAIAGISSASGTEDFGGWPTALQFLVPDNSLIAIHASGHVYDNQLQGIASTLFIIHSYNDLLAGCGGVIPTALFAIAAPINRGAAKHAYRTILSRHRAGVLYGMTNVAGTLTWDGSIAFSANWSNVASVTKNTGAGYAETSTTGSTVTITVPSDFLGGEIAICFVCQGNGYTYVADVGGITIGAGSLTVADASSFPQTGTFLIKIDNEELLVYSGAGTTTWLILRAQNGTSAAAHSQNAPITIAQDTHNMTWTGTVFSAGSNPAHPATPVGGQGLYSSPVSVVQRFALTSADAGKTIIATLAKPVAGDTSAWVRFDSWWIEAGADSVAPSIVCNCTDWIASNASLTAFPWSDYSGWITSWNTMVSDVCAEFSDGFSKVADVYTPWHQRNGVLAASMNNTDVTSSAVAWTAYDNSFTPAKGMMFCAAGYGYENMLVTGVGGSAPNWTLDLLRGQDGTAKKAHSSGDFLGPIDWIYRSDALHPSLIGHSVFAQVMYDTLQSIPAASAYQIPKTEANWDQTAQAPALSLIDNYYLYPPTPTVSTGATAAGTQVATPVYFPEDCLITEIGVRVTTAGTGTIRFGIYLPGVGGRPGKLLRDFGAVSNAVGGSAVNNCGLGAGMTGGGTIYQFVRKGWYWLSYVQLTNAATLTTITSFLPTAIMSDAPLGTVGVAGWQQTGITGALADWVYGTGTVVTSATVIGRVFVRVRKVPQYLP